ncbi:hypothetical protein CN469_13935 [Bacillus cereus]|nr:hypothetical protein CN469_13935 [Bacillus cereus]
MNSLVEQHNVQFRWGFFTLLSYPTIFAPEPNRQNHIVKFFSEEVYKREVSSYYRRVSKTQMLKCDKHPKI